MPLSNLLKSAAGTCPFCNQKAGILSREHPECRRAYDVGWHEMVDLAADAAGSPDFDEGHLRLTLSAVAKISYGNEDTVNQALEEGWKQGVAHSMADGIITQDEEARLREFRDQLALGSDTADSGAMTHLDRASQDRLMLDARLAAIAVFDGGAHLQASPRPSSSQACIKTSNPCSWSKHGKPPSRELSRTGSSRWTRKTPSPGTSTTST